MQFTKCRVLAVILLTAAMQFAACADGGSGALIPTSVTAESGNVYIPGKKLNPDKCASDGVAVVRAANPDKANRMTSLAVSALLSSAQNFQVVQWRRSPVAWVASAQQVVSVALSDG